MSNPSSTEPVPNEAPVSAESSGKKKREICSRCGRPKLRACICAALPDPDRLISLQKSTLVVLQHPHEAKRKNRSLPLVEMCLQKTHRSVSGRHSTSTADCDLRTVVARRFGSEVDPMVQDMLSDPHRYVILVYPNDDAVSLTEALAQIQARRYDRMKTTGANVPDTSKIVVILLDATWKFAREMNHINASAAQYPDHTISVTLRPEDWVVSDGIGSGDTDDSHPSAHETRFQPRRFDIRTPPSPNHMSTAECIAWVISRIEQDISLYTTIMSPLDLMVEKWHSFSGQKRSFTDGDGNMQEVSAVGRKLNDHKKKWVKIEPRREE